jgi:hypothetical protein
LGENAPQSLDRLLGAVFLNEGEDGVHQHDGDDGKRERLSPCDPREDRPCPKEQGKQVDQVGREEPDV